MDRERIIELARKCGIAVRTKDDWLKGAISADMEALSNFANLVAAETREECARVCELWVERYSNTVITNDGKWHGRMDADECAAAIRNGGK